MTPEEMARHEAAIAARYVYGDKPDDMREAMIHALSAIVALAKGRSQERLF